MNAVFAPDADRGTNLFQEAPWAWRRLAVPVVAAVHGHCLGGGLQIALAADYRFTTPDATWSVLEAKWGLVPDMSGVQALSELVRIDVAKRLAMTGEIFDGTRAVASASPVNSPTTRMPQGWPCSTSSPPAPRTRWPRASGSSTRPGRHMPRAPSRIEACRAVRAALGSEHGCHATSLARWRRATLWTSTALIRTLTDATLTQGSIDDVELDPMDEGVVGDRTGVQPGVARTP